MDPQPPVQYPPTQYPPPPPPRSRMPWWVCGIVGCGCMFIVVPILAAILLPVFMRAREKARAQGCVTNVRLLCLGVRMYAQDYDESLPIATRWMDGIRPYLKDERSYHCPSVWTAENNAYGYAYNSELSGAQAAQAGNAAMVQMIFDSSNLSRNASDPGKSLPDPPRHARHYNTLGFLDGHVRETRMPGGE